MKKMITMSLVAAATTFAFASTADDIADLQKQIDQLKAKTGKINAQSANDNIKWGVDLRTGIDNINYDMADGNSYGNDSLMSMRLWLDMAYAPDSHNVFKGRLSMNKAFGADFGDTGRSHGLGEMFDWTGNAALADSHLKVSEAYWLYLGDNLFGANIPWTFSLGRRPSTSGFLANLREDDPASSPMGHVINVEFDGLSSKLDLSNITGIPGMSIKLCMGRGSSSATPLFETATPYADDALENIDLAGIIFEPYNDGQFIVKTTWFKAFDLPGMDPLPGGTAVTDPTDINPTLNFSPSEFQQYGDMQGAAISVLVDGLTEDGYFADAKVFGSFAWSKTEPEAGASMLGSNESETGTSYWFGAQLPVTEKGVFGLEYNHGSQYWRPFTYAEDTMIGSKLAARGDAYEAYFTYQLTDALSAQVRYTNIDYEYTGSQGFFGNYTGGSNSISVMKAGAASWDQMSAAMGGLNPTSTTDIGRVAQAIGPDGNPIGMENAFNMAGAKAMLPNIVESAQDFRFYLRYRF